MPTYEFVCPDGHTFDKFYRKMSDGVSELPCLVCGKLATRKVSGGAGLLFKGSGFYITDYGKDGKKGQSAPPKSGESSGAKSTDSGGGSASSESKPSAESKPAPPTKSSSNE